MAASFSLALKLTSAFPHEEPGEPHQSSERASFVDPPSGVVEPGPHDPYRIAISNSLCLRYLNSHHDVSAQTIYDDIHGFIKNANVHRSAYTEFHIGGLYLKQGNP